MRKLTETEFNRVKEVIEANEWVLKQVNNELNAGKGWDNIMYQVAVAFKIIAE